MIKSLKHLTPQIDPSCYVHEAAVVIGDVRLAKNVSLWPGTVLRGDVAGITVGENSNIQDGSLLHTNHNLPIIIGTGVTVGHGVIMHGCTIGNNCLIGMGSIILDGAVIEEDCIIGAGALVTPRMKIEKGQVVFGMPAKVARAVTDHDKEHILQNAREYIELSVYYKESK